MNSKQNHFPEEQVSHHVSSINHMGKENDPHEYELIENWQKKKDEKALSAIFESHKRLVGKLVNGYRGYGLPTDELFSEAHIGMMHALKGFDVSRGYKFSTYAVWWIKSTIQEYVFKSWSLIAPSITSKNKRMFFHIRSLCNKFGYFSELTAEQAEHLANELQVTKDDIVKMHQHLSSGNLSLNASRDSEDNEKSEWIDWVEDTRADPETHLAETQEYEKRQEVLKEAINCLKEREHVIFIRRRLEEPPKSLEDLSQEFEISKERVRQIENRAFEKLQTEIKRLVSFHHLSY